MTASRERRQQTGPYHHGRLRDALLEAGLAQLETAGGEHLSLRGVARQVGVSPNAVYRHFASKEALLVALATEGFHRLRATQDAAERAATSPAAAMVETGLAYIRFAAANPALFRLMMGRFSVTERDPGLSAAMKRSFDEHRRRIRAASRQPLDDDEVSVRAVHALALAHGLSLLQLDGQIAEWTAAPDATVAAVMDFAARLRTPKPGASRATPGTGES